MHGKNSAVAMSEREVTAIEMEMVELETIELEITGMETLAAVEIREVEQVVWITV